MEYHKNLLASKGEAAREYLKSRGIVESDIESFNIGYCDEGYFANRVVFPVIDRNGELQNITSRLISKGKSSKSHLHLPKVKQNWFFNEKALDNKRYVILVESPIDCITLSRYGFNCAALMGVNNFNKGKALKLNGIKNIYLSFDNDLNGAGDTAANRVGQLIFNVTKIVSKKVTIPFLLGPDVNDMYQKLGDEFKEEYKTLVKNASRIKVRVIKPKIKISSQEIGKVNILDVMERYTEVIPTRTANQYMAICPLHEEEKPSLSINSEKNLWHCFGCGQGGNAINFVQKIEAKKGHKISFKEALDLAQTYGSV